MVITLRAGGLLREKLQPDLDAYSRRVEIEAGLSLAEILTAIGLDPSLVAFAVKDGKMQRLSYVPSDGDVITLQPPVSGG